MQSFRKMKKMNKTVITDVQKRIWFLPENLTIKNKLHSKRIVLTEGALKINSYPMGEKRLAQINKPCGEKKKKHNETQGVLVFSQ